MFHSTSGRHHHRACHCACFQAVWSDRHQISLRHYSRHQRLYITSPGAALCAPNAFPSIPKFRPLLSLYVLPPVSVRFETHSTYQTFTRKFFFFRCRTSVSPTHATLRSGLSPPTFLFPFFLFLHAFSVPQLSESTPQPHPCPPFIQILTDILQHHSHTVKASKSLQLSALSFAHSYLLTAFYYNTSLSLEHCSQCFAQELCLISPLARLLVSLVSSRPSHSLLASGT